MCAKEWPAEECDLARQRDVVDPEAGARHALIQTEQAARADGGELLRRGLVLDDDRDRPQALGERIREIVENVLDHAVEVDLERLFVHETDDSRRDRSNRRAPQKRCNGIRAETSTSHRGLTLPTTPPFPPGDKRT